MRDPRATCRVAEYGAQERLGCPNRFTEAAAALKAVHQGGLPRVAVVPVGARDLESAGKHDPQAEAAPTGCFPLKSPTDGRSVHSLPLTDQEEVGEVTLTSSPP